MRENSGKHQNGAKRVAKEVLKAVEIKPKSREGQLVDHLRQAEHHTIEAVKLCTGPERVVREVGYLKRLNSSQIALTGLLREELVRERGLMKEPRRKRG